MDNLQPIRDAVEAVIKIMAENEYAVSTIKNQKGTLNSLLKFMEKNHYDGLNE